MPFVIDQDSGAITVASGALLDYEFKPSYTLTVSVTDSGWNSSTSSALTATRYTATGTVIISLINVNDRPMIDDQAIAKVESHVADALGKGARLVAGGTRIGERFYTPTVLADVTGDMLCAREETFGPVAPLFRFKTEEELIKRANDTEYGLASYFYSRDIGRIWRVAEALEYGMVGINAGIISNEIAPFGGVKESGIGREGSKYGIEEFVEIKYLLMGGIDK